jgi:hypothetical protein
MSETRMEERVKISVALEKDEDDYPPADFESLWASPLGEGLYRVENIPFFAEGIALGDVISARPDQGLLRFQGVVQPSGHKTLRVIVYDKREVSAVRELLKRQGCDVEQSHIPGLISVDVPPSASLMEVRRVLAEGEAQERWGYEEAWFESTEDGS